MRFRWLHATGKTTPVEGGPTADASIEHPPPQGAWIEADHIPLLIAPDPGGVAPRAGTLHFLVEPLETPVQHSPTNAWSRGVPYPGPPARVDLYVDLDSAKWWGRTGQGQLVWSNHTGAISADLPSPIPSDMVQHVDYWSKFAGGYPPLARNRPSAFGDVVPAFNPLTPDPTVLAPG